jgi:hypothetical protein
VIDTTDKLREPKGSAPRNVAIIAMMKYWKKEGVTYVFYVSFSIDMERGLWKNRLRLRK